MIKVFVHKVNEGWYNLMVIDADMVLHSICHIAPADLQTKLDEVKEEFTDTGRRVETFIW